MTMSRAQGNLLRTSSGVTHRDEFSLAIAVRALAASTVAYLEPHSRGLSFSAFDSVAKGTLLPPFSDIVNADNCGKDISSVNSSGEDVDDGSNGSVEQAVVDDGDKSDTKDEAVKELQQKYKGDYELREIYASSGKQKVRCLIAVVHGNVRRRKTNTTQGDECGLEFQEGSISLTFRGTDTLENVLADVKAIALPYDCPPFIPSDMQPTQNQDMSSLMKAMKRATVHNGFKESWYGDELRNTVLQYTYEKMVELYRENREAQSVGLPFTRSSLFNISGHAVSSVDICGHSLGGAIAVLAAFDLANLRCIGSTELSHLRVYTFGCPRVGNVEFASLFNEVVPCWNVINENDIVPAIPHSPSFLRRILPAFCHCNNSWYRRHGRAVIVKANGNMIINPSRKQKYRREANVLRLKKATDSHMTGKYRNNIRAAIQVKQNGDKHTTSGKSKVRLQQKHKEDADWVGLDDVLDRLEQVITEARSDPTRSFHFLPGGT